MPNETNTGTRAYVPGKQVTVAHLIAHPAPEICEKAGIPDVDAIGILTLTPGETAIIAGDMAVRSADVNVAFLDRFSGTLILYGSVGAVEQALTQVNDMLNRLLQFTICPVTRHCRRAALGPPPFRSGFGRGDASRAIRCVPPAFRGGGRHAAFNPEAGGIAYLRARRAEAAGAAGGGLTPMLKGRGRYGGNHAQTLEMSACRAARGREEHALRRASGARFRKAGHQDAIARIP